ALKVIESADVICFLIDGKTGVVKEDRQIARRIRTKPNVLLVVNKLDSPRAFTAMDTTVQSLGINAISPVSAITGAGVGDLLDAIHARLPHGGAKPAVDPIRIAIIGKTNTGKSTMLNGFAGEERVIATSLPHTTREPRDTEVRWHGNDFVFVDTAGLRKERKISDALDRAATIMSHEAIEQVHIALVVIDVTQAITMHDLHVIDVAVKAKKGIIIVMNKWDLIKDKTPTSLKEYEKGLRKIFTMVPWAPILFISALDRQRLTNIFKMAQEIRAVQLQEFSEEALDRFLERMMRKHAPSQRLGKKRPHIYALQQESTDPPRFRLIINEPSAVAHAYIRFLEGRLRKEFDFTGVPIGFTLETAKRGLRQSNPLPKNR
ncbi:MAG: ribosome biogenesis GTPase Der, partial [Patescibacteria group bacterium]